MLLFTREQLYLNFIQVYLQGGQSVLQDGSHHLIVFRSLSPVHVVWRDREKAIAEVAVQRIGTLQRRHFEPRVTAQKTCANDNVKSVGVQHFAVLGYLFIAHTHDFVDPFGERMVLLSPAFMATVLVFRILARFSSLLPAIDSVAPMSKTAL